MTELTAKRLAVIRHLFEKSDTGGQVLRHVWTKSVLKKLK